jgi:5-formyltetrahydrofolate cyclo-ligase
MSRAAIVREKVWARLRAVARPDSRFDFNFAEVIPDFEGSEMALERFVATERYKAARYVFVTPDNGLAKLRSRLLEDGKSLVVSTYGIYRGFFLLEPQNVPKGHELYAGWLDGLEHFGRSISLAEIAARGRFDFMATGASAVSMSGLRFGKGHGFFDLEWGMFTDIGVADETTFVAAFVHDVQVLDEPMTPGPTDISADLIVTPTRMIATTRAARPTGVKWDLLSEAQIATTPPLQDLRNHVVKGQGTSDISPLP